MASHVLPELKEKMEKSIHSFTSDLAKLRTGRVSPVLFENIRVDYYGTQTPIQQVANFNFSDPKLVVISPWEAKLIPQIEKAILKSELGFNPINDGKVIRLPIPPLTEERRKELVKVVKKHAEETKIALRHIRRDAMEIIKKLEKDANLPKDDAKSMSEEVEKVTQQFVEETDRITHNKESELMKV